MYKWLAYQKGPTHKGCFISLYSQPEPFRDRPTESITWFHHLLITAKQQADGIHWAMAAIWSIYGHLLTDRTQTFYLICQITCSGDGHAGLPNHQIMPHFYWVMGYSQHHSHLVKRMATKWTTKWSAVLGQGLWQQLDTWKGQVHVALMDNRTHNHFWE